MTERRYRNMWEEETVYRRPERPKSARELAQEAEQEQRYQDEAARREAFWKQVAAEDAAREREIAAARAERQKEADAALEAALREQFFTANTAASEADFKRLLPAMRDAELVRRTEAARNTEVEGLAERLGVAAHGSRFSI